MSLEGILMEQTSLSKPTKSRRIWIIAVVLIFIGVLSVVLTIFALQYQTVHNVSINLTKITLGYYPHAAIEFDIYNFGGYFAVTLTDATVTLYINGYAIQAMGFEKELLYIKAHDYKKYTMSMVSTDIEIIGVIVYAMQANQFTATLELTAKATSGWYSSTIEISYEGIWQ